MTEYYQIQLNGEEHVRFHINLPDMARDVFRGFRVLRPDAKLLKVVEVVNGSHGKTSRVLIHVN